MNWRNTLVDHVLLPAYYGVTLPYRRRANRVRCAQGKAPILVLFYHRIADDRATPWTHSFRLFRRQMRWLKKHCDLISLEEAQQRIRRGSNDRIAATITFDDGYADNCDRALPLLIAENIPCTYFVSLRNALKGKPFPHDLRRGVSCRPNSIAQLCWLAEQGIEIGAHTRSHADLGRVTDECKLYDEVVVAGEELQSAIGSPVRYFSFPFGLPQNLNHRAFQMAYEYGYEAVCSAYGDYNFPGDDPFHLRRIHVDNMARLKNWGTIDPRKVLPSHTVGDYLLNQTRELENTTHRREEMSTVLESPAEDTPELRDAALEEAVAAPRSGWRTDTLAESVVVLLIMAAVQRIVGFVRGVLVCRWLSPDDLGQWDMAFGFLTLAAPLTVLGLPGSFGRYVEYFRQRGQLRTLVRRTAWACAILTGLSVCAISLLRTQFSLLVFGETDKTQLVITMVMSLVAIIAYNFLTELLNALRMARVNAIVQFFNSLAFAGFSILLLLAWQREAASLVTAYGLSCLVLIGGMLWFLNRQWQELPPDRIAPPQSANGGFWSRLLPFAAWVWVTNLLYNLFDVVDRYMIVHTSRVGDPLAEVGNYHSSRIVPLLLVSISTLMGTMLLPHLSHDWESGRRKAVSNRMNLALKLLGLLLFAGSIAILLASPWLFGVAFKGKFAGGMAVLPWTLTYCMWFGMATMAQMYLWCAERARLGCAALLTGLITNVVLNTILLPRFGLLGAVWATGAANAVALILIYRFNTWMGMQLHRSVLLVSLLPISLGFGAWAALATLAVVLLAAIFTDQLFDEDEKRRLTAVLRGYRNQIA